MEKERGRVEQADERNIFVRIQQSSHCATCQSRDQCHTLENREMQVKVPNTLQAKEGDLVEIAVPTRALLKLSLIVYLGPILMLLAGAFLGNYWAQTASRDVTLPSVIGGLSAMGISFLGLKWMDRRIRGKMEYSPRLLRIVTSADSRPPDGNR
ncbi:MAG: SoxR reducing system RseC family protein [Deltaproteobacteria bacterium]|nr:SoxR reducing system RseC family protein [Deltaproteobacteria bacterium]